MDRLFVRFIKFPDDNVSISVMDRVSLVAMFGIPGRDYQCPNVMGCLLTKTNGGRLFHEVNLMTGMSRSDLKSTFVHECAHAWMVENLPPARNVAISGDAKEGFCELVSHMVMDSLGDQAAINAIKQNTYTRGQVHLFIEAERQVGFNEIVEWMKFGVDDRLRADNLMRVREVVSPGRVAGQTPARPAKASAPAALLAAAPPTRDAPAVLTLQGVTWSRLRPVALINDRNFVVQERGRVRVGTNTVNIVCLAIRQDSVLIQDVDTAEQLELKLKSGPQGGK